MINIPLKDYWSLLYTYLKPQSLRVVALVGLLFGTIALQIVNPQIMRVFIDTAVEGGASERLLWAAGLFTLIALLNQVSAVATTYVSENVAWTATNELRADLAAHCVGLDMAFHNARTPGEFIERIDTDVNTLSAFFSQLVIRIIGNALLLVGVLVVVWREDWRVGVALAVFSLVMLLALGKARNWAVPALAAERQSSAALYGFVEERLAGLDDLRANGGADYTMRRLYERLRDLFFKHMEAAGKSISMTILGLTLFAVGYIAVLGIGGYLYLQGAVTIGTVYLFFQYIVLLRMPLEQITQQMKELQTASAGIYRLLDLYRERPAIVDGPGAELPDGALDVDFDGVSFAYAQDGRVLHDFDLRLRPGTVLGLLGRTGSGKSTIVRLLFRLYDPTTGAVRLNGTDIREMKLGELRQRVAMVTQDVQLFQASIRDNLTLFDPAIPDIAVLTVLRDLGLWAWYEKLPQGLDTELGPAGAGLSAGEAQLLALARVFLRDPGLVILDEASSRLDPATEALIERAISKLLRGRTAIIIAHRLATVQRADEILILDQGRIVEHGRRLALLADPRSRFAELMRVGLAEGVAA